MLGWYRVSGDSMLPTLTHGTSLLTVRRTPQPGRVVVARAADGRVLVKRVKSISDSNGVRLASDNPDTTSMYLNDALPVDQVLGEVVATWPPRRLRLNG